MVPSLREGFCTIKYTDMYAGLLTQLKQDLIGTHVPTMYFNIDDGYNFPKNNRRCETTACQISACKVGQRGVLHKGEFANPSPVFVDPVACMKESKAVIISPWKTLSVHQRDDAMDLICLGSSS